MIVAPQYRKTKDEISNMVRQLEIVEITPQTLLMIDYAYHNTDDDYDNGLSFLDRLHKKLSKFYPIQWNVPNLKQTVRDAYNPSVMFIDILNEILTDDMVACYGI